MTDKNMSASFVNWDNIQYFTPEEFDGHIDSIDAELVYSLNILRILYKSPIYISPSTWGNHKSGSYHEPKKGRNKFCCALDIFPSESLLYAYQIALSIKSFGGIGVYPFWGWKYKRLQGGLHIDIRMYTKYKSLWWYTSVANKGEYKSLYSQSDYLDMVEVAKSIGNQK